MKQGQIDPKKVILTEDEEKVVCFIINTLEYCDSMIPSLEELIQSKIDESYREKVDFSSSKETFSKLINMCLERILASMDAKIKD